MDLKELFENIKEYENKEVKLQGWIRNHRKQKTFGFIEFSDGTSFKHMQLVYDDTNPKFDEITKYLVGCAITVTGTLIKSEGSGQDYEVKVSDIILEGNCPDDYPLQSKGRPTREYLREQA